MNSLTKQQRNTALQIPGIIQNYRKITTRTGKPMASFTVGTFPAKCFDALVDTAEHWAATGKTVLVSGHVSHHEGTIELVAQSINLAPAAQIDTQAGFSQGGYADLSAQSQVPTRERSIIAENLLGCVSDLRIITTRLGRPMITFKIGNSSCKAFGDLASAIHKTEGRQIEVSARRGNFQGVTEYAIETLKTINGTALDLRDTRTISPGERIGKTTRTSGPINPAEEMDRHSFELSLQSEFGSGSHSPECIATMPDQQPPVNPGQYSSREEQTVVSATIEESPSRPEFIEKHGSGLSASTEEALILQRMQSYRNADFFPDKYLEKWLKSGSRFGSEAARRVLEERVSRRAEDDRRSEDFVVVEAA